MQQNCIQVRVPANLDGRPSHQDKDGGTADRLNNDRKYFLSQSCQQLAKIFCYKTLPIPALLIVKTASNICSIWNGSHLYNNLICISQWQYHLAIDFDLCMSNISLFSVYFQCYFHYISPKIDIAFTSTGTTYNSSNLQVMWNYLVQLSIYSTSNIVC